MVLSENDITSLVNTSQVIEVKNFASSANKHQTSVASFITNSGLINVRFEISSQGGHNTQADYVSVYLTPVSAPSQELDLIVTLSIVLANDTTTNRKHFIHSLAIGDDWEFSDFVESN